MTTRPTKREVASALAEMHTRLQRITSCYRNDVPGYQTRADDIADLEKRANQLAEILWEFPPDYPTLKVKPRTYEED